MNLQYVAYSYFLIKTQLEMWSLNVRKILYFNKFSTMFYKQGSECHKHENNMKCCHLCHQLWEINYLLNRFVK